MSLLSRSDQIAERCGRPRGGTGTRVGLSIPKQLIKVAGKPIIEHTLGLLNASPQIDEIIVLMTPGHLDAVHAIVRRGTYPKVTQVLEGADTRNATTQRALDATRRRGVQRPLPRRGAPAADQRMITDCLDALDEYEAVDMAIPSADTIIQVDDNGSPSTSPAARPLLRRGQTPQASGCR